MMIFTNQELAAILKLATLVANADGKVSNEESQMMSLEIARFGVNKNKAKVIIEIGAKMSYGECCQVVSNMVAKEKKYVAAYLGTLICADGKIDDSEIKSWSLISAMCDLPTMNIHEAIEFMTNF